MNHFCFETFAVRFSLFSGENSLVSNNFLLLLQAQFVSQTGPFICMTGMIFWLKEITNSTTLVGLFTMSALLPGIILGPLGGVLADRCSRKRIVAYGEFVRGLFIIFLGIVLFFHEGGVFYVILLLFLTSVLDGIICSCLRPAVRALTPHLVSRNKLKGANGLLQTTIHFAELVGQALSGMLFMLLGCPVLLIISGVSNLWSGISVLFITSESHVSSLSGSWLSAIKSFKADGVEGVQFVLKTPGLADLFLAMAARFFFMAPVWTLLPFFVEDNLSSTPDWYGFLMAGQVSGMILGSMLASFMKHQSCYNATRFIVILFSFGILVCLFSHSSEVKVALFYIVFIGICIGYIGVVISSVVLLHTPEKMHGRIFGLMVTISSALIPVSAGMSGYVAECLDRNLMLMYSISGFSVILVAIFLSFSRGFYTLLNG